MVAPVHLLELNKGMAAKCRVDDQNSFEMWRKLHKAVGPAHPEEGRQMVTEMRSLFTGPSTSTEEPWKKIAAQDKLNAEHLDKLGWYAAEADMVSHVWFGMTAELARVAARVRLSRKGVATRRSTTSLSNPVSLIGALLSKISTRMLRWGYPRRPGD